jgi:NADP-reducing hydrogenase subunit HndB
MVKIKSVKDLQNLQKNLKAQNDFNQKGKPRNETVLIKIAMATCSMASGATQTMQHLKNEIEDHGLNAKIIPTGCMGYCYAEPTVEITLPGQEPVLFGFVDQNKAKEIVERFLLNNEKIDGIIPVYYTQI